MRNLILFGLLIILLLAVQFTSAKSVDEIIDKYIRARGGKQKLAAIKSIYMEGTSERKNKEAIIKIIKEQDKLSRTEIETAVAKGFLLITENGGWTYFSLRSPAADKVPDEQVAAAKTEMDIAGPMLNYIEKGHRAELLGKELVEENTCYKIRVITREGRELLFWIDAATYLLSRSMADPVPGSKEINRKQVILYRDYKGVDGVQFAHLLETKTTGTNIATEGKIIFHQIILNPEIDSKLFQPEY